MDFGDPVQEYKPWMEVSTFCGYVAALVSLLGFIVMLVKWKLKKGPVEQVRERGGIYFPLCIVFAQTFTCMFSIPKLHAFKFCNTFAPLLCDSGTLQQMPWPPMRPATPGNGAPVFAGIRVVEMASVVAAPSVSRLMSDFGAEVIKVTSGR